MVTNILFSNVDLPDPKLPTTPITSPLFIDILIFFKIGLSAKENLDYLFRCHLI